MRDQVEPGLAGHLEVAHDQLEGARREVTPYLEAVLGGRAHVAGPLEDPADEIAHVALVVDDENARRCGRRSAHALEGSAPRAPTACPVRG